MKYHLAATWIIRTALSLSTGLWEIKCHNASRLIWGFSARFNCRLHPLCWKMNSCVPGSTTDALAASCHKTLHIKAAPEHANTEGKRKSALASSCLCHMCARVKTASYQLNYKFTETENHPPQSCYFSRNLTAKFRWATTYAQPENQVPAHLQPLFFKAPVTGSARTVPQGQPQRILAISARFHIFQLQADNFLWLSMPKGKPCSYPVMDHFRGYGRKRQVTGTWVPASGRGHPNPKDSAKCPMQLWSPWIHEVTLKPRFPQLLTVGHRTQRGQQYSSGGAARHRPATPRRGVEAGRRSSTCNLPPAEVGRQGFVPNLPWNQQSTLTRTLVLIVLHPATERVGMAFS